MRNIAVISDISNSINKEQQPLSYQSILLEQLQKKNLEIERLTEQCNRYSS